MKLKKRKTPFNREKQITIRGVKLDIGGLKGKNPGYKSVNINNLGDINHDLNKFPYPFKDNSVDEIIMSHVLEHLDRPLRVMEEIWRICKPGAIVNISVPSKTDTRLVNPYHLHDFKPEWFKNLNPSSPATPGIEVKVNFRLIKIRNKRGTRRFWKKYGFYAELEAVK